MALHETLTGDLNLAEILLTLSMPMLTAAEHGHTAVCQLLVYLRTVLISFTY